MVERRRELPETLAALERISWNYWWSWAADGAAVFRDLDPATWEACEQNARRLLVECSEFRLTKMATDPVFIERVERLAAEFDRYLGTSGEAWAASEAHELTAANPIAYFCAEFGIHSSLPMYSGGLGILAGDHLKSASDLGLPLVAVGLLYHHGYFRQRLGREGWQEERYNEIDPAELPLQLVRDDDGAPVRIEMLMRGRRVLVQAWRAAIGRVTLYLLDTRIPENDEIDRYITGHLYGGNRETRCVQEMVLGMGGVRLLRRLGIEPHAFHLNEGHSAFLTLELARELTSAGVAFEEAAGRVRDRCVFTTHTPIAAGHDEFVAPLVEMCFGTQYWEELKLSRDEFLNLGRVRAGNQDELFGLTPLALRMCRSTNGVSRLHGEVSRELWAEMWPERPLEEVPITHITNGVHAPTWVNPLLRSIYEKHVGANWAEQARDARAWAEAVESITDEELWKMSRLLKQRLIAFMRQRLYQSRQLRGESAEQAQAAHSLFTPEALTIGFARRVAAYKRWNLILTDPQRLIRLVNDTERPVQFVFAGKAHPQDNEAKLILQQLAIWGAGAEVVRRVVFIEDYDQEIARQLVQSVDVWLNVPRRPLEASGTSGEKVAMNGGLNLSILDGWWPEGFDGQNGWAIGDAHEADIEDQGARAAGDTRDAEALYQILEREVVPLYYERDAHGLPRRWVQMMKHAIRTLVPAFNSDRMVQEYTERIYLGR